MRRKIILFLTFIIITFASFAADKVSFELSAPNVVRLGEQFRLSININANGENLKLPSLSDFNVLMGPSTSQSSSVSIVNGNITKSSNYSYTYILSAKKEGKFDIGSATIEVDGEEYTSNSTTINVVKGSVSSHSNSKSGNSSRNHNSQSRQSSSNQISKDDLFLRLNISKRDVYKGEQFIATLKLYNKGLPIEGINNAELPSFTGFWAQEIDQNQNIQFKREAYKDDIYNVAEIKQWILFPQQSGAITIDPAELELLVRQRVRSSRGMGSPFDDFFDSYRSVPYKVQSNKITIHSKTIPSNDASFIGAVGQFSLKSSISDTEIDANDGVTLKLTLNGRGNLNLISAPSIDWPADFEVYDPQKKLNTKVTSNGIYGDVTFEYLFQPKYGGVYTIPASEFKYFDSVSKSFKTLKTDSYTIHVKKGDKRAQGSVVSSGNFTNKEDIKQLGKDIRYIKADTQLSDEPLKFFSSNRFYILYIVALLLILLAYQLNKKRIANNEDVVGMKNKRANKMALKRLKNAEKQLKSNNREGFYEEITKAFWGYLEDKLNIPKSHLTKDYVEDDLKQRGITENTIQEFMEILNTCEFARFTPDSSETQMQGVYDFAVSIMSKIDKEIKNRK